MNMKKNDKSPLTILKEMDVDAAFDYIITHNPHAREELLFVSAEAMEVAMHRIRLTYDGITDEERAISENFMKVFYTKLREEAKLTLH